MKRLCLLLFCSLSIVIASAETLVRGKVKDAAKGSGVAYATVSASRGSSIVTAVAADASGNFELRLKEDGDYSVELSAVGYQTLVRSVSALGKPIELGEVLLSEGVAVDAVQ